MNPAHVDMPLDGRERLTLEYLQWLRPVLEGLGGPRRSAAKRVASSGSAGAADQIVGRLFHNVAQPTYGGCWVERGLEVTF
jgi:hypothetical protein